MIKVTSKYLHKHSISAEKGNKTYIINENIVREQEVLRYLSTQQNVPNSIVKYHNFFQRYLYKVTPLFFIFLWSDRLHFKKYKKVIKNINNYQYTQQ